MSEKVKPDDIALIMFSLGHPHEGEMAGYEIVIPLSVWNAIRAKYRTVREEVILDNSVQEFFFRLAYGEDQEKLSKARALLPEVERLVQRIYDDEKVSNEKYDLLQSLSKKLAQTEDA